MDTNIVDRVSNNSNFQTLVARRTSFAWILTIAMLVIYFGFIFLVAFAKNFLAIKLGIGVTTIGIPIGIGVIISAFVLTGIYVRRANAEFDALTKKIVEEVR